MVQTYIGIKTCQRCGKIVPDTPYCIYCGRPTDQSHKEILNDLRNVEKGNGWKPSGKYRR